MSLVKSATCLLRILLSRRSCLLSLSHSLLEWVGGGCGEAAGVMGGVGDDLDMVGRPLRRVLGGVFRLVDFLIFLDDFWAVGLWAEDGG